MMGVLSALGAAACGTGSDFDPPADAGIPPGLPAALLAVEAPEGRSVTLVPGEMAEIVVLHTEMDGAPIAGERIVFAFEGRAHDSTLTRLEAITDATGHARGEVVAGMISAAFRVRITAERAAPAYVEVSVGSAGFGALRVDLRYDGMRSYERRVVALFADASCGDDAVLAGTGDRVMVLEEAATDVQFFGLPAGLTYAVVGRAEGPGPENVVLASGCSDGVVVEADREVTTTVTLADNQLVPDGAYLMQTRIDATVPMTRLADTVREAGTGALGTASDAAFLLEGLELAFRARGADSDAEMIRTERASGDLDAELARRLSDAGLGPTAAVYELADTLASRLATVGVDAELLLAESPDGTLGARWMTLSLVATSGEPDGVLLAIDLRRLGFTPEATIEVALAADTDTLTLTRLALGLPLGRFGEGAILAMVEERRAAGGGALLVDRAGCVVLADLVAERTMLGASCGPDCVVGACAESLQAIADRVIESLGVLDVDRNTIVLGGEAALEDSSGDLRPDVLTATGLLGRWGDATGTTGDAISGTASAVRAEPLP